MTTILNDTRIADFTKRVAALGRKEGEGTNSRHKFGRELFLAAADQLITVAKGDANPVLKVWRLYQTEAADKRQFKGSAALEQKSEKAQVSKANQHANAGGMACFNKVHKGDTANKWMDLVEARIAIKDDASDKAVRVFDIQTAIMRAQLKKGANGAPLTSDEIDDVINKTAKQATELSQVKQEVTKLNKMAETYPDHAEYFTAAAKALGPLVTMLEAEEEGAALDDVVSKMTPEQKAAMIAKLAA